MSIILRARHNQELHRAIWSRALAMRRPSAGSLLFAASRLECADVSAISPNAPPALLNGSRERLSGLACHQPREMLGLRILNAQWHLNNYGMH
jgi:hypothetical protein